MTTTTNRNWIKTTNDVSDIINSHSWGVADAFTTMGDNDTHYMHIAVMLNGEYYRVSLLIHDNGRMSINDAYILSGLDNPAHEPFKQMRKQLLELSLTIKNELGF